MKLSARLSHGAFGAAGLVAASMMRIAVQFLIFPIVGRCIGPEGYGQVALVGPFICFALLFAEAGLGTAIIRVDVLTRQLEGTVFLFSFTMSCAIFAIFAAIAGPAASFFHAPQFAGLLVGMAATLVVSSFNVVPISLLLRAKRYNAVAASDALSTLVGVVAVFVGIRLGWGAYSLVLQQMAGWLSRALFGMVAARWLPVLSFRRHLLAEHLGLGAQLTGASVVSLFAKNLDNLLIGRFLGGTVLGYYALAFQFVAIPQMVMSGSTYLTAFGQVSEAERLQRSSTDIYLGVLRYTLLLGAPMVGGIAVVAPSAIPAILGANWQPAILLAILLAPYGFCETLWPSLCGIVRGQGRGNLILGLGLCNGLISIAAIAVAAPFGSAAVALAVSSSAIVGLAIGLMRINRIYGLRWGQIGPCFMPPAVATAIMATAVVLVRSTVLAELAPGIRLGPEIAVGALAYVAALGLFRSHYRVEIGRLRRLLGWERHDIRPAADPPEQPELAPSAVCVIIATKGRPEVVALSVARLARQTLPPKQIIVSCTTDADVGTTAHWPDVELVYGAPGLTSQRNRALRTVAPDIDTIVFFDDDFVPHDGWIAAAAQTFRTLPDVAAVTGDIVADDAKGPGIPFDRAVRMVEDETLRLAAWIREPRLPYGCNMAFRASVLGTLRFDERLTLYGWLEDADIGGAILGRGLRAVQIGGATGVHMGLKGGRVPGYLLGYSQVVNPLYLCRKGTLGRTAAFRVLICNVVSNAAKSFSPEPHIDRAGRLQGNWLAFRLMLRGRLDPDHRALDTWLNARRARPKRSSGFESAAIIVPSAEDGLPLHAGRDEAQPHGQPAASS